MEKVNWTENKDLKTTQISKVGSSEFSLLLFQSLRELRNKLEVCSQYSRVALPVCCSSSENTGIHPFSPELYNVQILTRVLSCTDRDGRSASLNPATITHNGRNLLTSYSINAIIISSCSLLPFNNFYINANMKSFEESVISGNNHFRGVIETVWPCSSQLENFCFHESSQRLQQPERLRKKLLLEMLKICSGHSNLI